MNDLNCSYVPTYHSAPGGYWNEIVNPFNKTLPVWTSMLRGSKYSLHEILDYRV